MKKTVLSAFSIAALALSAPTFAGDVAAGKAAYTGKACMGCHGNDGHSALATYPKLAGQHAAYTAKQLKDFKAGTRTDATMNAMVAALSDADIDNIAAYLESVK